MEQKHINMIAGSIATLAGLSVVYVLETTPKRKAKRIAKRVFKKLHKLGYSNEEIMKAATDLRTEMETEQ